MDAEAVSREISQKPRITRTAHIDVNMSIRCLGISETRNSLARSCDKGVLPQRLNIAPHHVPAGVAQASSNDAR